MILRWMVSQLVRQAAEQQLRGAVSETLKKSVAELTRGLRDGGAAAGETGPSSADQPDLSVGQVDHQAHAGRSLACLFALGIESCGLVDLLQERITHRRKMMVAHEGLIQGRRVTIVETGAGMAHAAAAAEELISWRAPPWIVSAGFAGALVEDLRRNDMLMADSVVDEAGLRLEVGLKIDPAQLAQIHGLHLGRLLTVDRLIRTRQERLRLAKAHQAKACDMESAAIAEVCRRHKTRFLSVRVISDALDDKLPPEVERLLRQSSSAGKAGAAVRALIHRPSVAKDFWKLREQALSASDRLAKFLTGVLSQLDAPEPPEAPAEPPSDATAEEAENRPT